MASKALSDKEVMALSYGVKKNARIPNDHKIQFKVYNELETIPDKDCAYFILYRSGPEFGHWVGLMNHGNHTLEVFDSYDTLVDRELKWTEDVNHKLGQDKPLLSHLLRNAANHGFKLEYNEMPFQKLSDE